MDDKQIIKVNKPPVKAKKLKQFNTSKAKTRVIISLVSVCAGIFLWYVVSLFSTNGIFAGPQDVFGKALSELVIGTGGNSEKFLLFKHIGWSFSRIFFGWMIAFVCAVPFAFLMGWYEPFKNVVDPWIQFFRTIPPIALIPLVILLMGTTEPAKIAVIFVTSFLVMVVTIYQGVKNMDHTLIKAAYTFGANDFSIFGRVVVPYTFPFILTAARLGVSTALTTLIASEMTGAFYGLGSMIQTAQIYMRMDKVLLGIVCIGIIGFMLDKLLLFAEKKLTKWQ